MIFEVAALLAQSKNENAEVRLNTAFLAIRIRLALPIFSPVEYSPKSGILSQSEVVKAGGVPPFQEERTG